MHVNMLLLLLLLVESHGIGRRMCGCLHVMRDERVGREVGGGSRLPEGVRLLHAMWRGGSAVAAHVQAREHTQELGGTEDVGEYRSPGSWE